MSSTPTPIHSARASPAGSALPSAYTTEDEWDPEDVCKLVPISSLSIKPSRPATSEARRKVPATPFPFLSLPSELRLKIYAQHFDNQTSTIDLDPDNYKRVFKKLALLRTCRQIYKEAAHYFYSSSVFRIFPTHPGRFFKAKKPLLARLSPNQRGCIASLELRVGPGWAKPPRGWVVNDALGLRGCVNVRKLNLFVECDPSDSIFNGFRRADGFYEAFCRDLLDQALAEMPWVTVVEFDAYPGVKLSGAMMRGLLDVVALRGRHICWGPERGWTMHDFDDITSGNATKMVGHIMGDVGSLGAVAVA